ncbi:MAG: fibronectin type III domain-containing protein, partial [Eubacterium sp.]
SERLHTCAACETMKAPTVAKSGSQIKVNWEIVGSHGYVVMWSTDPTFKTGVSSKYITGHSVNNYTITGINSNQTYYVRVRAWRNWDTGYVYGSWSENAEA